MKKIFASVCISEDSENKVWDRYPVSSIHPYSLKENPDSIVCCQFYISDAVELSDDFYPTGTAVYMGPLVIFKPVFTQKEVLVLNGTEEVVKAINSGATRFYEFNGELVALDACDMSREEYENILRKYPERFEMINSYANDSYPKNDRRTRVKSMFGK